MKKTSFLITCFMFAATVLMAQEITVTHTNAPAQTPFAQPFTVQYQLAYTPGNSVSVDEKSLSKDFEVTGLSFDKTADGAGRYDFTVVPFVLGKSTFTVTFLLNQDEQDTAKTTSQLPIEITPVKIFNDKKLREIRPAHVPAGWLTWLVVLLILAALIYTVYCWKRRLQGSALHLRVKEDLRPNNEIALSKIEALLNSGLWERKAYKLFYITLTDIFREYMWRQFKADTSADTSAELLRRVKNIPLMQPLLTPLKDFLSSGDLVKFAKAVPSEELRNRDVQILRDIVRETTPKPPTQQEKKA